MTSDRQGRLTDVREGEGVFWHPHTIARPKNEARTCSAAWAPEQGPPFNRIGRRAQMSACPTYERSSPPQRSSPAPGNHCLLLRRADKLRRRHHRQNRKGALPLRRRSRAATHVAVDDRTSWKLRAPTPLSRQIKHSSRSAVTGITAPSKRAARSHELKKVPAPDAVGARGKPAGARRGTPFNAPAVVQ
jgi:hypothetical protein